MNVLWLLVEKDAFLMADCDKSLKCQKYQFNTQWLIAENAQLLKIVNLF